MADSNKSINKKEEIEGTTSVENNNGATTSDTPIFANTSVMKIDLMLQQNKILVFQCIQPLTDTNNDVDSWYTHMNSWRNIHQVTDPKELFEWAILKVQGEGAKELKKAIIRLNGQNTYPDLEKMKDILLAAYNLDEDPDEIIDKIKEMKISHNGDLKTFNKEYKKLYNSLDNVDKYNITITDYLNAIENKEEVWKGVKLAGKKISLEKAMETAELYETVEAQLRAKNSKNFRPKNYDNNNNTYNNSQISKTNYNNSNSTYNKSFNNNERTFSRNKDNKENKDFKVGYCYFCHEVGHKKNECTKFNHYEFLKYKKLLEEEKYEQNQNKKDYQENKSDTVTNNNEETSKRLNL